MSTDRAPGIPETVVAQYLGRPDDRPQDWALIDNLDADEAREVAKIALRLADRYAAALGQIRGDAAANYFTTAAITADRALDPPPAPVDADPALLSPLPTHGFPG